MGEYAVYKGDELLAIGTTKELAKKFNVSTRTIEDWATPKNRKRDKGKRKVAVKL